MDLIRKLLGLKLSNDQNQEKNQRKITLNETINEDIPPDFVAEMKEAFYAYDKDESGFICSAELGELLRSLGYNPSQTQLNDLMAEVDVDHSGNVELEEFIVMMHSKIGPMDHMLQEMRLVFRAFDSNGDGQICCKELKLCMRQLGEKLLSTEVDEMVDAVDINHSGTIDFQEFVKMVSPGLDELQREKLSQGPYCSWDGKAKPSKQRGRKMTISEKLDIIKYRNVEHGAWR